MKRTAKKRLLCLITVLLMLLPQTVFAAGHITAAEKSYQVRQGGMLKIDLGEVCRDGSGHRMHYTVADNTGNGATTPLQDGIYYFTSRTPGEYAPRITASCGEDSVTFTLPITVEAAAPGDPRQYSYEETPAQSVSIYVTLSSDGIPLLGNDEEETPLMRLPVTLRYFDLELYDLKDFYRYATENGSGAYTGSTVIERPTLLHLYIYLLERYYMGLPEEECCTGESGLFDYQEPVEVRTMWGTTAYSSTTFALSLTGGSCSVYMKNFWGHDENLMYYRNHMFPLQSPGWGSTADYILLSDGDAIDLAMFTDWQFYTRGAFCCFDRDSYAAKAAVPLSVRTLKYGTQSVADGGTESFEPIDNLALSVYTKSVQEMAPAEDACVMEDDGQGSYALTFTKPGTYYLLAADENAGKTDDGASQACYAPAVACVRVAADPLDLNGNGAVDVGDLQALYGHLCGRSPLPEEQRRAADINGDGRVDILDYQALYQSIVRMHNK